MAPLPANCSVELWRRLDKVESGGTDYEGNSTGEDDGWFQCDTPEGTGNYNTEDGIEAVFNLGDTAKIVEFRIVLNCNANNSPEVFQLQSVFANNG
jgi:hypothetical protein